MRIRKDKGRGKHFETAKLGNCIGDGDYHYYCQPCSSGMKVWVGSREGTPSPFYKVVG